jgi:hypothetical protein
VRNILLGTPPNQITEAEKMRRLQDLADRRVALKVPTTGNVEDAIAYFRKLNKLIEEEHELDRVYPDQPP